MKHALLVTVKMSLITCSFFGVRKPVLSGLSFDNNRVTKYSKSASWPSVYLLYSGCSKVLFTLSSIIATVGHLPGRRSRNQVES